MRSRLENLLMLYARRFPIRRGKLRVINSLWRVVVTDECTTRVALLNHGGFKMLCNLSEMLQRQFYFFGTYFVEETILKCWENAALGAKVVLDVGANAGIYSLAALAVQPDAKVYAFEPTPEIAARLRATAKLNGLDHLYVHEAAVSNKNGRASLRRFRGSLGSNDGMNFITDEVGDSGNELVRTVRLDQFCQDYSIDQVDLLKIDVQGHEHLALEGARTLLDGGRVRTVFMELNWAKGEEQKCAASESIRLLDEAGYRFARPGECLTWQNAGEWLRTMNDIAARR